MKKLVLLTMLFMALVAFSVSASTIEFNGTVYDNAGNGLNYSLVNITIYELSSTGPSYYGSNATHSGNSSDSFEFNVTVSYNASHLYLPVVYRVNDTNNDAVEWVASPGPYLGPTQLQNIAGIRYNLKPAGTINITAINSTSGGTRTSFKYQIKDQTLDFDVASNWDNAVDQAVVYVPRNRNYSVMIYPEEKLPVRFDWNNFSSSWKYNITDTITNMTEFLTYYDNVTYTVHKMFNLSETVVRVSGYAMNSTDVTSWNHNESDSSGNFTVVPFLLEPGNTVYLGGDGLPWNMSSWGDNVADNFSKTEVHATGWGFYNISLPAPAEGADYLLFMMGKNGSNYWGGFRNVSVSYGDSSINDLNITMYGLIGSAVNHSAIDAGTADWSKRNFTTAKKTFNLVDENSAAITESTFYKVTLDYTSYGMGHEFSFMGDTTQGSSASLSVPLLNATGIKEMQIMSMQRAPQRMDYTVSELASTSSITLRQFKPRTPSGTTLTGMTITAYQSNSSCDLPNPPAACQLTSFSFSAASADNYEMMKVALGGGSTSIRMATNDGVEVHFVNVDMLASGPPDSDMDQSPTETTSDGFSSGLQLGSAGPKIYDYALMAIPYTEGVTGHYNGLDESSAVTMNIPYLYDENWNVVWNVTLNGTVAGDISANLSHYSSSATAWGSLLNSTTCTTSGAGNGTYLNSTNPCYVDTDGNKIWIRVPHFSGTKPVITGSALTVGQNTGSGSSSTGSDSTVTSVGQYTKQNYNSLMLGEVGTLTTTNGALGVTEITFKMLESVLDNTWLRVDKLSSRPSSTADWDKKVYKYVSITKSSKLPDTAMTDIVIDFKVDNNWLIENGVNANKIALYRFANEKWNRLETTIGEDVDGYTHYTAETPGFSYFAIGERAEGVTYPTGTVVDDEPEATIEPEPTLVDTEPEGKPWYKNWVVWLVIGIVVLLIAAAIALPLALGKKK